jgi:hypothetical protein
MPVQRCVGCCGSSLRRVRLGGSCRRSCPGRLGCACWGSSKVAPHRCARRWQRCGNGSTDGVLRRARHRCRKPSATVAHWIHCLTGAEAPEELTRAGLFPLLEQRAELEFHAVVRSVRADSATLWLQRTDGVPLRLRCFAPWDALVGLLWSGATVRIVRARQLGRYTAAVDATGLLVVEPERAARCDRGGGALATAQQRCRTRPSAADVRWGALGSGAARMAHQCLLR